MKKIRVVQTITITNDIPFTRDYYPELAPVDIDAAVNYEKNQPLSDKLQQFAETLSWVTKENLVFNEEITVIETDDHA